jgi:hypothetical protein
VVPFKADDVSGSSGGVAESVRWKWVISRATQVDCIQRFCVYTYYGRSRSSQMLADVFLRFSELQFCFISQYRKKIREKEKEKEKKKR